MRITVRYTAGPYSGTRIRKEMTLPMYYESYRVESAEEDPIGDPTDEK